MCYETVKKNETATEELRRLWNQQDRYQLILSGYEQVFEKLLELQALMLIVPLILRFKAW